MLDIQSVKMALSKSLQELAIGSDVEKGELCGACKIDGDYRQAVEFCLDCNQPICQTCVDCHRRIKQKQGHKLMENTPEAVRAAQVLSACLICPNHPDKNIELICRNHDTLCCSTCATVNHRDCRQVKEVATESVENTPHKRDLRDIMSRLVDVQKHAENLMKEHQKNKQDIQFQISAIIPKQIQEMRASLNNTLDNLEKQLLLEAHNLGMKKIGKDDEEISRWAAHIRAVNDGVTKLDVSKRTGTPMHKYIAAQTAKQALNKANDAIRKQGKELKLKNVSFSFKKSKLLKNASISINKDTLTLKDVDEGRKGSYYGYDRGSDSGFANVYVATTKVDIPEYRYGGLWILGILEEIGGSGVEYRESDMPFGANKIIKDDTVLE